MITRFVSLSSRVAAAFAILFTIAACGGGGGGGSFSPEDTESNYNLSITATNPDGEQTTELWAGSPVTLSVQLKGAKSNVNQIINLSSAVGTIKPENGAATTNSEGVATFVITFNNEDGAGVAEATYEGPKGPVTASINLTSFSSFELGLKTLDSNGVETVRFSAQSELQVEATLYRLNGNMLEPATDQSVKLGTTIGTIIPANGLSLTDENGVAKFKLTAPADGTSGAGSITATFASADEQVLATVSRNVEALSAALGQDLFLETSDPAGDATDQFGPGSPLTVTVSLESTSGQVEGKKIDLASTIGSAVPPSKLTDAAGQATFSLEFNDVIGAGVVTATYAETGGVLEAKQNVESVAPGSDLGLQFTLRSSTGGQTRYFAIDNPMSVSVSVVDKAGNLQDIDNEIVFLALEPAVGTVTPDSALTNNGIARFELTSDNSQAGVGVLTATYGIPEGTLKASTNVEAYVIVPPEEGLSMTLSSSSGSILEPSEQFVVTARLTNLATGTGKSGALVTLTPSTVAALVAPVNGSAVTDNSGVATFTLEASATADAGPIAAAATVDGVETSNTINLQVIVP